MLRAARCNPPRGGRSRRRARKAVREVHIVLIATAWGTAKGGINAFNQPFAKALALVGRDRVQVTCAVAEADQAAVLAARSADVRLVAVGGAAEARDEGCARAIVDALSSEGIATKVDLWVGHDVITGFAAASAGADHGGRVALIHHMDFESYKNIGFGRGEEAARRSGEQIDLFSTPGATLFGVGNDLRDSAARLGQQDAHRLIPGFPDGFVRNSAGHRMLHSIVAGRFDASGERIKQSRLTAAAVGRAVSRAGGSPRSPLARATLSVFGAEPSTIRSAELELLANRDSSILVNVVPTIFDSSTGVMRNLARSNLAFMPSVREGFGLIGWEAIGCEVPLILGAQTGLHSLLDEVLDGRPERWVTPLQFTGRELDETDLETLAEAIVATTTDLEMARATAAKLREILKDKLGGCTWPGAAHQFLEGCGSPRGASASRAAAVGHHTAGPERTQAGEVADAARFHVTSTDHRDRCAELELDERGGQGSDFGRFDVLATLRFGRTNYVVDGMELSVGIRRAQVHVSTEHGALVGQRLGEGSEAVPGISCQAGGIWELENPAGGVLTQRVLGDEVLCRISTPPNLPAHARVDVMAAPSDIECTVQGTERLETATERVMKLFLEKAVFEEQSGYLVLSTAEMREPKSC